MQYDKGMTYYNFLILTPTKSLNIRFANRGMIFSIKLFSGVKNA